MTSFENVEYGSGPSPCSPKFEFDERGVKIAMPDRFEFSGAAGGDRSKLPLCISIQFDALYLSRFEFVFRALKVVVVDDERQEVFNGGVWRDRHYVPLQPSPHSPEKLAGIISGRWRNVDLLEFIPLPRRPAKYHIYALLEEHKSNVVTLQVDVP